MKRWLVAVAVLLLTAAEATHAADWLIVPGRRAGPIDATTSEKRLIELFGAANVAPAALQVEPGVTLPATALFVHDVERRLLVVWRDPETRASPESVFVRGERSLWRTDKGISLGTPLATLRRLNGKPLTLTGFGWDLSGTVLDANGGSLTELGRHGPTGPVGRTLVIRVEPDPAMRDSAAAEQTVGDREFSSDSDAMRALKPRVYELIADIASP